MVAAWVKNKDDSRLCAASERFLRKTVAVFAEAITVAVFTVSPTLLEQGAGIDLLELCGRGVDFTATS